MEFTLPWATEKVSKTSRLSVGIKSLASSAELRKNGRRYRSAGDTA